MNKACDEREWPLPEAVRVRLACIAAACQDPGSVTALEELLQETYVALPVAVEGVSAAATDVLAERQRQVLEKGWSLDVDDGRVGGELERAAACYAVGDPSVNWWPRGWIFRREAPRAGLVKAGALILAAIERLDRLQARTSPQQQPAA